MKKKKEELAKWRDRRALGRGYMVPYQASRGHCVSGRSVSLPVSSKLMQIRLWIYYFWIFFTSSWIGPYAQLFVPSHLIHEHEPPFAKVISRFSFPSVSLHPPTPNCLCASYNIHWIALGFIAEEKRWTDSWWTKVTSGFLLESLIDAFFRWRRGSWWGL